MTPASVIKTYGVGRQTLRRWHEQGRVRAVTMPGGKHLYNADDVRGIFGGRVNGGTGSGENNNTKATLLYARVSSEHQRGDLARQIDDLKHAYPQHERVYQDIASGLNWKRPGLTALLERVHEGGVGEVVVSKTCGRCGSIHSRLGGSKVFVCPQCSLECDRDLHAARNVLLRFLSSPR